jgi:hypothetical protein
VGHVAKAYEWALRLSSALSGIPWWVERLKQWKDLDNPYSSCSAMGAFAGAIYGYYKTNDLKICTVEEHFNIRIKTLEKHLNSSRYRAIDAINNRLQSVPFIHSFLKKFLRRIYRAYKSARAKYKETLS